MAIKTYSLFELRQLASIDVQAIAQTCKQMRDEDANSYGNFIILGARSLKRATAPEPARR